MHCSKYQVLVSTWSVSSFVFVPVRLQPLVSEHHRTELKTSVVSPPVASDWLSLLPLSLSLPPVFWRTEAWGLWGSGWGEPCPQGCLVACLVNLGATRRRLEAKQKPGCGRCGYGICEETATCTATLCCCKMLQCLLSCAEVNKIKH